MKKYFLSGSVCALILGFAMMGSVYGQNAPTSQAGQPQAQAQQSQDSMQQDDSKAFTGTIMKQGNKLVLRDASANINYKVDDEDKVKDYVGKQVKITGTLDTSTNVIHVDSIEVVS
ncbi:MAG TPA: DUF5818 domain-containing protein [Terriglobales bacterium]|nr:DUF5818 domain-containing protein [Terriglobales bacterium]